MRENDEDVRLDICVLINVRRVLFLLRCVLCVHLQVRALLATRRLRDRFGIKKKSIKTKQKTAVSGAHVSH